MEMLVSDFLAQSARRYPDKVALICDGQRLTYKQVEERCNEIAHGLADQGIQPGDRVAVWLPNSVESVLAIFGILKADAVFTVINSSTKLDKLTYVLNNCTASGLFAPIKSYSQVIRLLEAVPSLRFATLCGKTSKNAEMPTNDRVKPFAFYEKHSAMPLHQTTIDIDLACLIYTSGSTGDPKGVMSTHANMVFAASSIIQYLENNPDDIVINVLPLSFDYGLYQLLMVFKFGGTLVLERSFAFPAAILKRIAQEKVTGLPGVPTVFALMLQMDLTQFDLSSLRYLTNTAAALPVDHIQRLRDAFPWTRLYSMYGLTECKRTLYLPPEQLNHRPGSVGIAIPGTEVWIEDEDGTRLGPDQVGELVVRGSHVMQGYWNAPELTAHRYRPGRYPAERYLYTGDLFKMDAEGYLYFVARKDDIIKSRGEKVAPKEVESAIYQLEGIVEVAVIGTPDPLLGEAIKAFVVTHEGVQLSEQEILRHCRQHLEDFMVPKQIEFMTSLPKTSSGKIKKTGLR